MLFPAMFVTWSGSQNTADRSKVDNVIPTASTPAPPVGIIWDTTLLQYRFHETHPMDPIRLDLTHKLCQDLGLLDQDNVTVLAPEIASDAQLATVHDADYINAVRAAENGHPSGPHGLGTEDTPIFDKIHHTSARIAGGSIQLAEQILDERITRGVNFAGGMHHASRSSAGGFCVYNDAAAAIQRLLDGGVNRVVYIDVDAHHGDGTQDIFYADPRVMTISLHQSGTTLFPGTGFPHEIGGDGSEGHSAAGTSVNIALPAGTNDAGWMRAFHSTVPALVAAFGPEVIVSQHGCDAHADDPMSDLMLSVDAMRQVAFDIAHLTDDHCGSRWIATGGGGYSIHTVVPRAWAQLTAVAVGNGVPLHSQLPADYSAYLQQRYHREFPTCMDDEAQLWWRSWELGFDPENSIDRAIMQTRRELFPFWGLDPWFD